MAGQFELLFFGMFLAVVSRYVLPFFVQYIRSYAETKQQEYLLLVEEEQTTNRQLEEAQQIYSKKLTELEAIGDKFDSISQEVLSDFRKKNEDVFEMYKKNEQLKIRNEIAEQEEKVLDSCMELLEAQVHQELKAKNITCFDIALDRIREIMDRKG